MDPEPLVGLFQCDMRTVHVGFFPHPSEKRQKRQIIDSTVGGNLTLLDAGYIWRYCPGID
jgi:hypothetical protein